MKSDATTVEDYISELSEERQEAVSTVREVVLANLPEGYEEMMDFGMIAYVVPLAVCPKTYNGHPLMYAAIASEKNYVSVHLMNIYASPETPKVVCGQLQGDREADEHGEVLRTLSEAG